MENIVTAPKTDMFRFRINPEIRKQVEEVYAKNGLTFTEIKTNSLHRRRFKICLAITKEERLRQRKNCAAIDKDTASPSNDNFLITVPLLGSFPLLVTVLFVGKGG